MFWLRQLFRVRERMQVSPSQDEAEMSIIDHLEALRSTIIRMAVTLLLSMILCFGFSGAMMSVLRQPVDNVWELHEAGHLPAEVKVNDWIAAKSLAAVSTALPREARELLQAQFSTEVQELAAIVPLLHAAALLPQEAQIPYLQSTITDRSAQATALALHVSGAELKEGQGRAALKLMGAFRPGEAFMLSLQLSFFGGLIISFPLLMYFLLQFIMPGLLEHEKRLLCKSVICGFGLFLAGCAFAYFAVLPRVLSFFYTYSLDLGIENDWRIGYYLTFAAKLVFVFGVIFELPVIIVPLIKLGILNYARMKVTRGYALIGCFAAALFLAPAPDPATMFIMALPMYALYELCIFFAYLEQRKNPPTPHDTPES
ncbi:MAG: twin-arginine translocase subunit TatC [Akkermansia sp.]|nr:twin-arginine translocase subunit TatC [Akkermansia sp.]